MSDNKLTTGAGPISVTHTTDAQGRRVARITETTTATIKPNHQPRPGPIANAQGIIVPDTEANPYGDSAPPIAATEEEQGFYESLDIPVLQDLQQSVNDRIDGVVEASGYSVPVMVIGSIATAATEVFLPTNVIDLVPGGKLGSLGKKAGDALKRRKKAKNGKKDDGGKDKGKKSNEKGRCGEKLAKQDLMQEGFDEVIEVQNNSGHGVDLIGRNSKTGEVKVWEVKTTEGTRAPSLSDAQSSMGGADYTADRLRRAAAGRGNYGKVPEAMRNAKTALKWMNEAGDLGKSVTYEVREVFIDDITKGCAKSPKAPSRSKPWPAKK